ncbi:MAG: aconitase family protein [Acidobacteriota bacterium]
MTRGKDVRLGIDLTGPSVSCPALEPRPMGHDAVNWMGVADWWRKRKVERRPEQVELSGRTLFLTDAPDLIREQLAGRDLGSHAEPVLRNDVSTDEIAPARICYYFDDTLGEFPYTGLECRGERPVARGAVKAGGFVASAAGRRRGKGSSREAAPYAELAAGIRLAVAESFERIYEANCVNLGVLTSTDRDVLTRLGRGELLPLAAFTAGKDPITAQIVRFGGLFPFNVARFQGIVDLPELGTAPRPMTVAEKIVASHVRRHGPTGVPAVAPGDAGFITVDLRFSHEYVTPMASMFWDNAVGPGIPITDHESVLFFRDHLALLAEVMPPDEVAEGRLALARQLGLRQAEFARRTGVRLYGGGRDGTSEGICHTIVLDRHAVPGQVVLGTDSHTCQAGALGALAIGCGTTEMFNAWFTRDVRISVPPTVRVEIVGTPSPDVAAKDLALLLLAHHFVRSGQAVGRIIEFGGPVVRALPIDERATLTNMAAEVGGLTGIVEPDMKVVEFLADRRDLSRSDAEALVAGLHSDPGCQYAATITLDASELEPLIATPGDPGNGRPARELEGLPIQIAYGGSCTAGKRTDMDMLAGVLAWGLEHGLRAAAHVRFFIQCGSQDVLDHCRKLGHTEVFARAGAILLPPGCGACINAGPGVSTRTADVTVSSINRNFPGRSGPGQVYLASPTTVAASALAGHLTTWPTLRRRIETVTTVGDLRLKA